MNLFGEFNFNDGVVIEGLTKELSVFYVLEKFRQSKKNVVVVFSNLYESNKFYQAMTTYTSEVLLFPMDDFFASSALAVSPELKLKRLETLENIRGTHILITNLMGYLKYLPNPTVNQSVHLTLNENIDRDKLLAIFEQFGYKRDSMVTSTGEYAVRGFIIDIFLINEEHPIRIEFFGSSIESIRYFDEDTQRSLNSISEIECFVIEEQLTDSPASLLDYVGDVTTIIFDKEQLLVNYRKLILDSKEYFKEEQAEDKKVFWYFEELHPFHEIQINLIVNELNRKNVITYHTEEIMNFHSDFTKLHDMVFKYLHQNKTVIFALSKESQIKKIKDLFQGDVNIVRDNKIILKAINILAMKVNHGFIWDNKVIISEYDIEEIKEEIKYKNNLRIGKKIHGLDSLNIGDYIVHRFHGIGIYNGVVTLMNHGVKKDYIQISYLGNDKVYIPVEKISTLYKYSDKDGLKPQINKIGSTSWLKKKQTIQKRIHDISKELVELYAKRSEIKGEVYQDYPEEQVFASSFPYPETRDQTKSIQDISKDLSLPMPMDRLLCGDVGFGKTEVAFRGMFKTILNNKQVMYLCPTTILSKQQYESAKERFKDYPIEIALLNRFTTPNESKRIIEDLKNGKIDIIFGTHRLLSQDIAFKRLGLLIVDEEQRFGVTHKEKIKKLKTDVNVLTLSATPIPRTLKMALSGLRDLSIIDTPPVNRYPVQTYVVSENDLLIRDAIYKELARNGQVFVLYNRVETIENIMSKLQRLVPEAKIRYAHGQMNKQELDEIMDDFVAHYFDVLLSTTIIETGIDIPNANTLIIYDADYFGLSQLYQLRGRVGRSDKIAYAYLLYKKNKSLNDIAVKRLQAIRDFTELGSGYKVAMRDLSIRGAGDILGSEQAGFVDSIGINLYMKMIEEEMKKLHGEVVEEEDSIDKSLINVETHIDNHYVSDEEIKIEIHQMINQIDSYQKLEEIKNELTDRFGTITPSMEVYMYEEWFEKLASQLKVIDVIQNDHLITIIIPEETSSKIKGDKLLLEALNIHPKFQIKYENKRISITLYTISLKKHFIYYVVPLMQKIVDDLDV